MSQHPIDRPDGPPGASNPRKKARSNPQGTGQLPRYKLVLQSGGCTDMMNVVRTVMELTRLCRTEATHKMWEAHHFGRSQLLVTYKERAELYVEQFAGKGVPVTIEPAG